MLNDLEYLLGELSAGTDNESVGTLISVERQPGLLITATHRHLFFNFFVFILKVTPHFYPRRTAKKGEKIRYIFFLFF
jgi:hypothetical protein